jgi:hypothetical protein
MTATLTRRQPRPISPAAYALSQEGLTLRAVADELGVSREFVGTVLSGVRPMPEGFEQALMNLLGPARGRRVLSLVPDRPHMKVGRKPQRRT